MGNFKSVYQTKIEQQNEKLTALNKKVVSLVSNLNLKVDSLVSNIYSEKLKSDSLVSNLYLKVDSLVSNIDSEKLKLDSLVSDIDYLKLKSKSSKLIIF